MGKMLQIANEPAPYILVDRATWLAYKAKLNLKLMVESALSLHEAYSIIRVNPKRYPDLNHPDAITFSRWLASAETQQKIASFRITNE